MLSYFNFNIIPNSKLLFLSLLDDTILGWYYCICSTVLLK